MPECSILGFEPTLRLERGSQQLQSQEDQRNHSRQPDAILSLINTDGVFGTHRRTKVSRPFRMTTSDKCISIAAGMSRLLCSALALVRCSAYG